MNGLGKRKEVQKEQDFEKPPSQVSEPPRDAVEPTENDVELYGEVSKMSVVSRTIEPGDKTDLFQHRSFQPENFLRVDSLLLLSTPTPSCRGSDSPYSCLAVPQR